MMSLFRSRVCHSIIISVEVIGAQVKQWAWMQGQWPGKSGEFLLHMFKNSESNAELNSLDVESLVMEHIQVNNAPKM